MKFAAVSGQASSRGIAAARISGARPGAAAVRVGRWHRMVARATVDRSKVLEEVRGIICEQLGAEKEAVTGDAKFADIGADSLDTVEIMMQLEETYDIQLDEEAAEALETVQDAASLICDMVEKK
eukprot:evm.model.scf_666.4 EVM.evm.TU.scf_666.4   scf_666:16754-19204(-)